MDPEILKAAGAVLGAVISVPVVIALVKMIFFFGEMRQMVTTLSKSSEKMFRVMEDYGQRLARLEGRSESE